ncbi:TolC family protein [Nannocystis sp. SCPEA4]|uniref:TolC family protein n=1 Tax=Nannocystis sp. SCPEA4 TaxID=2996787 RepID=UPI00226E6303|nr:TolC family protein [Nannocystis sp. SCPEA4]MCY1063036.1 TolC family protein [Nannocystis sp. SCPEA4]
MPTFRSLFRLSAVAATLLGVTQAHAAPLSTRLDVRAATTSLTQPAREGDDAREEPAPKPRTGPVLALAEVLDSLARHDPRMRSADEAIRGAKGQLKANRGFYDPRLRARGVWEPFFHNAILDARVEQPTTLWGMTAWAGWQVGVGRRPYYANTFDSVLDVDDRVGSRDVRSTAGTLSAGVTLPLWRDGRIDRARADIRQSTMERDRLQDARDARRLELEAQAATAYWSWVAAGLQLEIEKTLLDLATERDDALKRRIELGALDSLAAVDNRRLILDRERRVVAAERGFQAAGLALSLYLRDNNGDPVVPTDARLPGRLPSTTNPRNEDIEAEIAGAIERRPDRRATMTMRGQADVELRWAKNQRAPRVDLSGWVAQYLGRPLAPELRRTSLVAAVSIEIPIPMRAARGQVEATQAAMSMIAADLRLLDDRIAVQVRDGHSALLAAYHRARLAAQEVELTRELARAEYRKFQLGAGDLMLVNLRELASADAATAEVQAVADYFVAKANLEVALGTGVQPVIP